MRRVSRKLLARARFLSSGAEGYSARFGFYLFLEKRWRSAERKPAVAHVAVAGWQEQRRFVNGSIMWRQLSNTKMNYSREIHPRQFTRVLARVHVINFAAKHTALSVENHARAHRYRFYSYVHTAYAWSIRNMSIIIFTPIKSKMTAKISDRLSVRYSLKFI